MSEQQINVLDYGYVEQIEFWGSDERIIEAARMSTNKGFQGWGGVCWRCEGKRGYYADAGRGDEWFDCPECKGSGETVGDEKLLRFLWENKHATPFEMAGATFEIKAPIFVFREWHRHRTQSYNEMSARYTPLPDENYVPTVERLMLGSDGKNKQAGTVAGAAVLDEWHARDFQRGLVEMYESQEKLYQAALKMGIPKELARVHLPVARYSRMRASANLRNWLAFLTLRMAPNAQWEIRQFANAVHDLLAPAFPRTLALFDEKP